MVWPLRPPTPSWPEPPRLCRESPGQYSQCSALDQALGGTIRKPGTQWGRSISAGHRAGWGHSTGLPIKTLEKYWIQLLPTQLCPCAPGTHPVQIPVPSLVFLVLWDPRGLLGRGQSHLAEPAGSHSQSQTPGARGAALPALRRSTNNPRDFC